MTVRKTEQRIGRVSGEREGESQRAAYLHSGFSQVDLQRQLLSGVDVRVVRLRENPLQLLELRAGERGPDAPLLPLLVQSAVIREQFVGNCEGNQKCHQCQCVRWKCVSVCV